MPMLSYYSFMYIIYFEKVETVSIDQYCVLQKINFWLSNLI